MQAASASHPQKARRRRYFGLQARFIVSYLFAVLLPILLMSIFLYRYHTDQMDSNYLLEKQNSLAMEQLAAEELLTSPVRYYNQLRTNYELSSMLRGVYSTEREVVYAYNSAVYSSLNNLIYYDPSLDNICVYAKEPISSRILKRFFSPLDNYSDYSQAYPRLAFGYWDKEPGEAGVSYYIGFPTPPSTRFEAVLRFSFNNEIFRSIQPSDGAFTCIYLDDQAILFPREDEDSLALIQDCFSRYRADGASEPVIYCLRPHQLFCSCYSLCGGAFTVCRMETRTDTLFGYRPFIISLVFSFCVLFFASLMVFLLQFRVYRKIIDLSDHMNRQQEHKITVFPGKVSGDEIGDLVLSFNQMASRINGLSEELLNQEMQLKEAQLSALTAQLNPHFFYGTLESIRMIAEAHQEELIADITFSFGSLMRYSLSQEYLVPVSREIDIVRQYLSIQEKRLYQRFETSWEICPLDDKWRIPKFSLFGMVENVFSHCISKSRDFVEISIRIVPAGTDLLVSVANTGPCIRPERLEELQDMLRHPEKRKNMASEHNGRSIFNISDRLKLFYGEDYRFSIDVTDDGRTVCSFRVHR